MPMLKLAWQQFASEWRVGDLRVLLVSLVLAVTAITAVGFFTNRVQTALVQQGGVLLGGDLVVVADHTLASEYLSQAKAQTLQTASTLEFASMVIKQDQNQLAEIKALGAGFPLRGSFTISDGHLKNQVTTSIPQAGMVWLEPRLAHLLHLKVGDTVELGSRHLVISAFIIREPSRGGNLFSFAPRLMMNISDVPSTGLIAFGSRVKYQLLLAGDLSNIARYADWLKPKLKFGERIEDVKTARPEIKSALEKSQIFLGLSALVSVVLSVVAMLLASQPYVQRNAATYALFRCFGASHWRITQLMLLQTVLIASIAAVIGCILGLIAQFGLALIAGQLFVETLPQADYTPVLTGFITSFLVMFSIMLPHLIRIKNSTALGVLRQDLYSNTQGLWLNFIPALLVLSGLMMWQAQTVKLALASIVGLVTLCIIAGVLAYMMAKLLDKFTQISDLSSSKKLSQAGPFISAIKLGLANLKRRLNLSMIQIIGFSLGLMVLMLLAIIRGDLMRSWQASMPLNAPNRFIINIQPNQVDGIKAFLSKTGGINTPILPMVRGRLIALNGKPVVVSDFKDERAKRLAEREFNLSWAMTMQADNKLVAGRWWTKSELGKPLLSLEKGLANTLGIKLGDRLTYDIAGSPLTLTVTNLREVKWDSMHANFFAITPPQALDQYPASYLASFYLPPTIALTQGLLAQGVDANSQANSHAKSKANSKTMTSDKLMNNLVQQFPNLTVFDVAAILQQVQAIISKMSQAVAYVFIFSLVAGVTVLYAALVATRDERVRELTLLRVLGASRRQVSYVLLAEFVCIGLIAACVASVVANALSFYISHYVLDLPYVFNPRLTLLWLLASTLFVPLAAWLVIRKFLQQPPKQLLNSI